MIREASSLLQLCKQLDAVADLGPEDDADVEVMAKASALVQHHDAVTDESTFAVTVFNSNSRSFSGLVTIPYSSKQAMVMGPKGDRVPVQLMKTFQVNSLDTNARAPYELVLPVEVGPLGYATYIVDNSTST
ncbi:unnamed protein product [Cylicostephanus goldi]|uniref:Uncharacterized protein n=2 Tax=Cylicostephanus goldi TaxID=71465 RepID=A0A3P7MNF8_CYLGO|nr:unnamed protein product [Cylicostephanus goldi]